MDANQNIYEQAKSLYDNGLTVAATELLGVHLADQPHDARCRELLGIAFHALKRFQPAASTLEHAGLMDHLSVSGRLALADCYWFVGRKTVAVEMFRHLAREAEIPFPLLSDLAMCFGRAKDYWSALDVCRRATERCQSCHHARYGVAYYMAKAKYPPELVYPVIKKAAEMAPHVFHYRMAATTILTQLQLFDRAYLGIADATLQELHGITCRCCLSRLVSLYSDAGDHHRAAVCEKQLAMATDECRGQGHD